MAISFTTGSYLQKPDAALGLTYPFWQCGYMASANGGTDGNFAVYIGDAAVDTSDCTFIPGYTTVASAYSRRPGESSRAESVEAVNGSVLKPFFAIFTGPNNRRIQFGSDPMIIGATSALTGNPVANYNRFVLGSKLLNTTRTGDGAFSIAEVAYGLGTPSDAVIAQFFAKTIKPEEVTGCLKAFPLQTSSDLTSTDGLTTLTMVGSVTTSGIAHPLSRSVADTTAPVLSSPVGASSGATTATGSVTTDEGNGTLYKLTSTNATETSVTIIASGATQTVTTAGVQNVTSSALTASTTYRHHFVQKDAANNTSNVVSSDAFTTSAAGDSTAPVLSSPTATATSSTTATGTVSTTNDANGALYRYASTNITETAGTIKAANQFQSVTATGVQNVSMSGLPPGTANLRIHYVHRDAAGNDSNVVSSDAFTTPAGTAGSLTFTEQLGNSATGPLANTTCTALIQNIAGQSVATLPGLPTDANGRLVSQIINNAALSAGTNYRTIFVFASGAEGMINRVAA